MVVSGGPEQEVKKTMRRAFLPRFARYVVNGNLIMSSDNVATRLRHSRLECLPRECRNSTQFTNESEYESVALNTSPRQRECCRVVASSHVPL